MFIAPTIFYLKWMFKIQEYHTETSNPEVILPITPAEIIPPITYWLFCCEIYLNPENHPKKGATEE